MAVVNYGKIVGKLESGFQEKLESIGMELDDEGRLMLNGVTHSLCQIEIDEERSSRRLEIVYPGLWTGFQRTMRG